MVRLLSESAVGLHRHCLVKWKTRCRRVSPPLRGIVVLPSHNNHVIPKKHAN